nr:LysE family transporter [uncultured Holophaga sp.]
MWRDKGGLRLEGASAEQRPGQIAFKAFLMNILNPKLSLFFLAFLPQFIHPGPLGPLAQMLVLSAVFMAMTLAVFLVYGFLAHSFRRFILDSPRVQSHLQRAFAATFAFLGLELALSDR